jgi:hypothetical protein
VEAKIYQRLEQIFTDEGYNVNPRISDIKNSDQLPIVWFDFADDETDVSLPDDSQEVSHLINELSLNFRFVLASNNENYRIICLQEIATVKKIINDYTQIYDPVEGCELARKWEYISTEIVNFNTDRLASGGIEVRTSILYSQLRSDPTNN